MNKKMWIRLCGYVPSKEQKKHILYLVQTEKISLAEACARFALPPLIIEGVNDDPSPVEYDNPFRPAVYIKGIDD